MIDQFYAERIASEQEAENSSVREMSCGGFRASLMRAERLVGEQTFGLPPGISVPVFPIAALPGCPDEWVKAAGSYVCPVKPEWGLWFDWRSNDQYNTAVIPSVKGMNPITGMKIDHLGLEKYQNRCPKHDVEFSHDRYCPKCDYRWPPQNYICYPNILWWDGFRAPDGTVRQFYFSENEKKDIATLVMGKQNTVPAFGFIFYQPKNPRTIERPSTSRSTIMDAGNVTPMGANIDNKMDYVQYTGYPKKYYSTSVTKSLTSHGVSASTPTNYQSEVKISEAMATSKMTPKKEVSVGGGAKIAQVLTDDPLSVDDWKEKESALIRLYFVFEPQFQEIVDRGGIKNIEGNDDGYLEGLPLG